MMITAVARKIVRVTSPCEVQLVTPECKAGLADTEGSLVFDVLGWPAEEDWPDD